MVSRETEDARGEVERILEMNVVTAGPARIGRVEAVMRATFLSVDAILERMREVLSAGVVWFGFSR